MILVDTSIWIDQLNRPDAAFDSALFGQFVVIHPYVVGEILLGNLRNRAQFRQRLLDLDPAPVAEHGEVLSLIESAELFGTGIGYVDAHLVASTLLMLGGRLWSRDRRLHAVAQRLGIAHSAD